MRLVGFFSSSSIVGVNEYRGSSRFRMVVVETKSQIVETDADELATRQMNGSGPSILGK